MRSVFLSFFSFVVLAACGATTQTSSNDPDASPGGDAATDAATDTGTTPRYDDPALDGPPVTSVIGRFHGGGNLLIEANGTWFLDQMGCAGGLCGRGRWTGDAASITLVADGDAGSGDEFPWLSTSTKVRSVKASVLDGKLHTIDDTGRVADFRDGYVCGRCEGEHLTGYERCDKMRCTYF